ncbi:HAMP domain-containing histidine kinase [Carnobacteriaceae bacterium zg-C25]|nr:HAMP domain-containing histidine kinase [Carnobacteriaceae bacterium zg-ZUI240]QTU82600.1 HAMP domain-containing histidine kinase [Carnobacteriaceae bacterium zg-C25]
MRDIYKNPQAKVGLRWLIGLSTGLLMTLLVGYHTILAFLQHQLNHHSVHLYVLNKHHADLTPYLTEGIFPDALRGEVATLLEQSFAQKMDTSQYHVHLLFILSIWLIVTVVAFAIMTLYFKRFFNQLNTLNNYVLNLNSDVEPIDIRQSNEGILSQLQHSLYQTATSLHTQYRLSTKHKDYLDANIANISHQLKTPLTALWVVVDSILALPIEKRTDDTLLPLEPQLERINTLIQAILLMTRLDAHAITFKKENVKIGVLIKQLQTEFQVLLKEKGLTLQIIGDLDTVIKVDRFYLYEAMANIIKNGIDHACENSQITITITSNIFYTSIFIQNEGQPIDKDDLPYIFQRFYKGKNAKTTSIGIGLALSHDILNQHSGKLSAKNVSNGVQFELTIPQQ